MKGDLDHEDPRLWAIVASTVRPAHGRTVPPAPSGEGGPKGRVGKPEASTHAARLPHPASRSAQSLPPQEGRERGPESIEPRRRHRIVHDREPLAARIDLHGMTWDAARAALARFIARAHDEGWRAVLVITGKGALGDGVLRRHVPEWLAEPPVRPMVAGVSEAHRRHGGEGALYVALKRRRRD